MRRPIVATALAALLGLSGCDLLNITQIQQTDVDVRPPCGTCGQATPTPITGIGGLTCQRDSCVGSGCSAATCTWPVVSAHLCARGHASLSDECLPVGTPPQTIDPGPPGDGGGSWQMSVEQPEGVILFGPVPVTLDT